MSETHTRQVYIVCPDCDKETTAEDFEKGYKCIHCGQDEFSSVTIMETYVKKLNVIATSNPKGTVAVINGGISKCWWDND